MEISVRVKEAIKERGLTQREVAELTGVNEKNSVFSDNPPMYLYNLAAVADTLGITDIRELISMCWEDGGKQPVISYVETKPHDNGIATCRHRLSYRCPACGAEVKRTYGKCSCGQHLNWGFFER